MCPTDYYSTSTVHRTFKSAETCKTSMDRSQSGCVIDCWWKRTKVFCVVVTKFTSRCHNWAWANNLFVPSEVFAGGSAKLYILLWPGSLLVHVYRSCTKLLKLEKRVRFETSMAMILTDNHKSVDFIFLSFGIMGFIVELWNYKRVTDEA